MKKILAIVLCLAMLCGCLAGCGEGDTAGGDKVIKIGIFEPASGANGAGGKQETLGIKYAHSIQPTVTIGGETYEIELVEVDNQSADDKAVTAAAELVNKGVSVVLGSYGSSVSIAASPTFEEAGIPAIGVTCTNTQVTEGNQHYFRICFLDPFQGSVLAKYAWDNGIKTAYTLAELGNAYDLGLASSFKDAFEKLGGKVIAENFPTNQADFTSYITNAKKAGAEAIFAPTSTTYAQLIIEAAATQDANMPLYAGDTWDSNVILDAAKGKNVTINVTTFYQEGGNPEYDKGFKDWINSDPQNLTNNGGNDIVAAVSAMGYDAYFVALEAIKAAGSGDAAKIKEALWNVDYTGVTGQIKFDSVNGDAQRTVAYIKAADTATGAWKFVKEQGV
ncbi:MAG: ABC transporter substrate-binding protein [Clostridia bacterium]|nr:ABC transporter substrate-binding protein [Clostridia bacterium]